MAKYKVTTEAGTFIVTTDDGQQKQPNIMQSILSMNPNASMGQQAGQAASLPFRGFRGVGVGLANLPKGPSAAIQRASEAVQPGFQPKGFAETAGSIIGESAPLFPLGGLIGAGARGAGAGAAIAGGSSALMQQSEQGKVSPLMTGASAALGGLLPLTSQGIKKIYPKIAAHFTKTEPEAFQRLMDDPKFLTKYSGTVDSIRNRANQLVKGFQGVKERLSKSFENFKEFYQLRPDAKETMSELARTSGRPRTISSIAKDLTDIKKSAKPVIERTVDTGLLGPGGKPLTRIVKEPGLFKREKLMKLLKLDQDLNEMTKGSFNDYTIKLKSMIADEIRKIPQGRHLQKLRVRWSEFKEIEENLGRDLADPDKAPIVLEKLMRGDIKGVLRGSYGKVQNAIKELESLGGVKPIMEPLRDEILAGMLRGTVSQYTPKGVIGKAIMLSRPDIGLAEMALSSPRFMAKATGAVRGLPKAAGKAVTVVPSAVRALQEAMGR